MPIYVYECKDCGAIEEHIQRFSDDPMTECETCGGRLDKQITSAAFHLKGGGWYKDGYASTKGSDSSGDGGGSDSGESSSGSSDKSESKSKDKPKSSGKKGKTKGSSTAAAE